MIQQLINKLKKEGSIANQEQAILKIVRQNAAIALDMNIAKLMEGKDNQNNEIVPPYSPLTVKIKKAKGQPYDRVTTRDEGEFHQKFTLLAEEWPIQFDSLSLKTPKLTLKYGDDLFGLVPNDKAEFAQEIKPDVQEFYHSLVKL